MQSNSLRASAVLSFSLTALAPFAACQATSETALPGAAADNDANEALPNFLLAVPGGDVAVGLELDAFIDATSQAAYPWRPEEAAKQAEAKLKTAMRRSASILGREKVHVEPFLLGKWPVKNREFKVYVDAQRAAKAKIAPPFHWWKDGCKEDYESKLKDISKAFPKDKNGALLFHERHGHEHPYALKDAKGNSIADMPVVFVSWRDANKFAASIGMRLPTELEMTRAMRGDGTHTWPLGQQGEEQDRYTEKLLQDLRMATTADKALKPVGSVPAASGPYGHTDLFGQVWQLCGGIGFEPIHGIDPFKKQWKLLNKDKTGRVAGESTPAWYYDRVLAKGGSYLSYQEPVQLMIDARAPVLPVDRMESLGFRLAKSLKPGYDFLYSLQRVSFSRDVFARDQDLELADMIGGERYTIGGDGFPTGYEAVALTPTNWLLDGKKKRLKQMLEETQESPLLIGALATTAPLQDGTEPGMYAVKFREAGIPRKLRDAVKRGHKEVLRERKDAEKNKDKKKKSDKKKDKKQDKTTWRSITRRYGLTDDDLADKAAAGGDLGFVRIDGVEVPTKKDQFVLLKDGKVVGALEGTNKSPAASGQPVRAGHGDRGGQGRQGHRHVHVRRADDEGRPEEGDGVHAARAARHAGADGGEAVAPAGEEVTRRVAGGRRGVGCAPRARAPLPSVPHHANP